MTIFNDDKISKKQYLNLRILFVLSGFFQGVSIVLTMPMFKYLLSGTLDRVGFYLLLIAITAVTSFGVHFAGVTIGNKMSVWAVCDAQIHKVGQSIIKLPLGWFDASSKGKIAKAISTDIDIVSHYPLIVLPELLTVLSTTFVIAVTLLFISFKYALIILGMCLCLFYFWKKNMKALSDVDDESHRMNQMMESRIIEFAQLQPVLRGADILSNGWDRLNQTLEYDKKATLTVLKKKSKYSMLYMLSTNLGSLLILIFSALEFYQGRMSFHILIGIIIAMVRVTIPLADLVAYMTEVFNIRSAINRMNTIIESERLPEGRKTGVLKSPVKIVFEDVNFSYLEDKQTLKNVNMTIPSNQMTALVGSSGSGKSTIHRLIARFWDVNDGKILFNQHDIKSMDSKQLMDAVSMVFQDVYLFDSTIRDNVAIGKMNATEEEIMQAAKNARLDEVIKRLPDGWDTKVGEGGCALSGGEKQRVSIARAFLKDAPILLLDEITSSLDTVNEAIINESLQELSKNKTVLIIAHRLPTIKKADHIFVMNDGQIIGEGTHEMLLNENDQYKTLWNALTNIETWVM